MTMALGYDQPDEYDIVKNKLQLENFNTRTVEGILLSGYVSSAFDINAGFWLIGALAILAGICFTIA